MSIVEVQIRTDRFCELVKGELNSRTLPSAMLDDIDELKGKHLERIECLDCTLVSPSEGGGEVVVGGELAFRYHASWPNVRAAGSLQPAATAQKNVPYTIKFKISFDPNHPQPPLLRYEALLYGFRPLTSGTFALELPGDLAVRGAAIEATDEVVAIRIGTSLDDPVNVTPVDHTGRLEWIQLVPGDLIAETIRRVLDRALDEAVKPPPPPDPNKPWIPKPKDPPKLRKEGTTSAAWGVWPQRGVAANGGILVEEACPTFDVDISVELTLLVTFEFPNPDAMTATASLTWDADSTWCDILNTVTLGVPFGIGFSIAIEDAASSTVLGKSLNAGGGFSEIGRTDSSITFQSGDPLSPTPSREFVRTHAEAHIGGIASGGQIRPKVAPALGGEVIAATAGLDMNCRLRAVSMVFNPAQVVLRNTASGYIGRPPRVFLEHTVFEPAGAWTIRTDVVNMSDPRSTAPQTVLTFVDPPAGRLAKDTPTSVYLATDFGFRWADLGVIPEVPSTPPVWAERLMEDYCDSISNPWGHGMTQLGWDLDPLLDPDYAQQLAGIDAVRLWSVGLQDLPDHARIEFLAVSADGDERLLGVVEGRRNAALQLITDANETLAVRPSNPFEAPAPTVARSWILPSSTWPVASEPVAIASVDGLLGLTDRDGTMTLLDPAAAPPGEQRVTRRSDPRAERVGVALAREHERGREAWSAITRLGKDTIAFTHRGQLLVGTVGPTQRIQ